MKLSRRIFVLPLMTTSCGLSEDMGLSGMFLRTRFFRSSLLCLCFLSKLAYCQDAPPSGVETDPETEMNATAPESVEVDPLATDDEIETRLRDILAATEWYQATDVSVKEGIVTLNGISDTEDHQTWAGDLARKTRDVVAVINKMRVEEKSIWDLTPAWKEVRNMGRETVQALPLLIIGLLLLLVSWFAAKFATHIAELFFVRQLSNKLLRHVISRAIAIPVFLIGVYFILRIAGLTQIATTVIGGTGLIGLIIGIGFRDIAENFLASILISLQRPFALGDTIQVNGYEGVVHSVTTRGTVLMTFDGNHVQIPNSSIYKSVISNYTANPKRRFDFMVGIDYTDSASHAQEVILGVLRAHDAVLEDPEPMVLVEELGTSTVNLRVYAWIDGHKHSFPKVRSALIRLTKRAIEEAGLTLPDESREVIFPRGVPIQMVDADRPIKMPTIPKIEPELVEPAMTTNDAEGGLESEVKEIEKQAQESRSPDEGENLLDGE